MQTSDNDASKSYTEGNNKNKQKCYTEYKFMILKNRKAISVSNNFIQNTRKMR